MTDDYIDPEAEDSAAMADGPRDFEAFRAEPRRPRVPDKIGG